LAIIKKAVMKKLTELLFLISLIIIPTITVHAQRAKKSIPVFQDGEAQIVPGFKNSKKWIRHDLWVEADFDTDGDGN
jgi:X-Pro dipeptidyl-peptidase